MNYKYWDECISISLEEAGIKATKEQIAQIDGGVAVAHENYGLAHGHECIPNPLKSENERLARELKKEQRSSICRSCNGRGSITSNGWTGVRSTTSQCPDCRGMGKIFMNCY